MSTYRYLIIFITFFLFSCVNAEEIEIESIQSSQGANITCSDTMEGQLILNIMGEIGKRSLLAVKKDEYIYLIDKNTYYSAPIYENPKQLIYSLELSRYMYFLNGKPLSSPTLNEEVQEISQESYNILKNALHEAHKNNSCINWNL